MKKIIQVDLGPKKYDVVIQKGLINNLAYEINKIYNHNKITVITDENVYAHFGNIVKEELEKFKFHINFIRVKPGENSKSFEVLKRVYEQLVEFNLTRSDLIIALGGGVVGDLAGFVASTYLRGVDYIQIPTTLLAQIDSSIGGKVAVNLEQGKNLVGSFYQPKRVLVDPNVLETLPDKYIKDGLGEIIKYACIRDAEFFNMLTLINNKDEFFNNLEHIIYTCVNIKRELVENDEHDKGERMFLNFGHTLGHAIEKYFKYEYSHGEAVSLGMYYITRKSENLGITEKGTTENIKDLLTNFNIKYNLPNLNMNKIIDIVLLDKKNISGNFKLILLNKIGDAFIKSVPIENIKEFFEGEL